MEAASGSPAGHDDGQAGVPSRQPEADLRSRTSQALGVAMIVAGLVALVSAVVDGPDAVLQYAAPAVLFGLVGWATFFQPGVVVSDGGVLVRNTWRSIEIPWPAVQGVEGRYGLRLVTAYGSFTAWGAGAPRGRARMHDTESHTAEEVQRRLELLRAAGYLDDARLEWAKPRVHWHVRLLAAAGALVLLAVVLPVFS